MLALRLGDQRHPEWAGPEGVARSWQPPKDWTGPPMGLTSGSLGDGSLVGPGVLALLLHKVTESSAGPRTCVRGSGVALRAPGPGTVRVTSGELRPRELEDVEKTRRRRKEASLQGGEGVPRTKAETSGQRGTPVRKGVNQKEAVEHSGNHEK